jgi:hypothetical protein
LRFFGDILKPSITILKREWERKIQWIGLRERLQETILLCYGKIHGPTGFDAWTRPCQSWGSKMIGILDIQQQPLRGYHGDIPLRYRTDINDFFGTNNMIWSIPILLFPLWVVTIPRKPGSKNNSHNRYKPGTRNKPPF